MLRSNNHNGEADILEMRKKLENQIAALMQDAMLHNATAIKNKLKEIVPEYTPQENEAVL